MVMYPRKIYFCLKLDVSKSHCHYKRTICSYLKCPLDSLSINLQDPAAIMVLGYNTQGKKRKNKSLRIAGASGLQLLHSQGWAGGDGKNASIQRVHLLMSESQLVGIPPKIKWVGNHLQPFIAQPLRFRFLRESTDTSQRKLLHQLMGILVWP